VQSTDGSNAATVQLGGELLRTVCHYLRKGSVVVTGRYAVHVVWVRNVRVGLAGGCRPRRASEEDQACDSSIEKNTNHSPVIVFFLLNLARRT